jgi:nicotinate-nucleotide adenylyltransferase
MKPLLLFGGTFDPIHYGHLRVCTEAADAFGADQLHLVPSRSPPNRHAPSTTPAQRAHMLGLALQGQTRLAADHREWQRPDTKPSYTLDTLKEVRAEVGPDRSVVWLIGADQFARLHLWHQWQRLLDFAHLAVLSRPDAPAPKDEVDLFMRPHRGTKKTLLQSPAGYLASIEVSQLAISSTQIRKLIHAKQSARFLLPDSVLDYIHQSKLYLDQGSTTHG